MSVEGGAVRPTVSVVMPTLNQHRFIGEALDSVFGQGIDSLELVVVDGGSVDGTQDELAARATRCKGRLRWMSAPDGGPAQAVNRAVEMAHGEVIGWLNSDDLYAPGAVARALDALDGLPGSVIAYGEGEHIDALGHSLGRYPTLPPTTSLLDFMHGCFVCQPTAFFRRQTFRQIGGLDESLRTAFDFDLWLRVFKAHPDRIAFVPQVQAFSRLHEGSITLRQRERVALEGMTLLHRHLGEAPAEWLLTHIAERCALHPFSGEVVNLRNDLASLVEHAQAWVSADGMRTLRDRLVHDRALQLATPYLFVAVYPDGWAPRSLELRLRMPSTPCAMLRVHGRHSRPGGGELQLRATAPDGSLLLHTVPRNGPFEFDLPLRGKPSGSRVVMQVVADECFVPAACEAGSTDRRELAFLVEGLELRTSP